MNFPLFIAKRYFFAKKSHNAINVISMISLAGVALGTMALVIVLSVFNGFDKLIQSLYNSFDPDMKISLVEGKSFIPDSYFLSKLSNDKELAYFSTCIEENALIKYGAKQYVATVKGVDSNFKKITGLDTMMVDGKFQLSDKGESYAVVGQGVAYYLQLSLKGITPLIIYLPKKTAVISMNPEAAFIPKYIFPSGVFTIEAETDAKYVIVPLRITQELLDDTLSINEIDVKLAKGVDSEKAQIHIQQLIGSNFKVLNRYQQKEVFYRIMKYEKWAIFMILTFILMVASFNIVGSLSMLIIEKKRDISTFNSIGADRRLIQRIFLFEGTMISIIGAAIGMLLGLGICFLQMKFGLVKLQGSGSFIINAYPVKVQVWDIILVIVTVIGMGYLAALYPVKFIIRKYLILNTEE